MKHWTWPSRSEPRVTALKPGLRVPWAAPACLAVLTGAAACSSTEQATTEEPDEDIVPQVETPAADGPKLVALKPAVVVYDRPSTKGKPLGTLRAGARLARGPEAYSKKGCPGGWYNVAPRGWVCVGADVSLDLESPLAKVLEPSPNLERPMPYRYGRVRRGAAVIYGTLPTPAEQLTAEPKLKKRQAREPQRLGTGANDVPCDDESLMPSGPPVLLPEAEGVGSDGYRTTETWFTLPGENTVSEVLPVGTALRSELAGKNSLLKRHSGVAIMRSVSVGGDGEQRHFGVMPDGRFVPIDRLKPALGSTWHGLDVRTAGLPVAFTLRVGVCPYELDGTKKAQRLEDEELGPRQAVALTGRFRTVNGVRYYFTRDDQWLRHKDIILIPNRNKFPDFATGDQKWLDISLANQTMVAYEGKKAQWATLVSSGQDRLGDPNEGPATIQGVFKVRAKHVTRAIDEREVGQTYSITDTPWVLEFAEGFAITASYWQRDFGEARSYHNVTVSPIDAHWIWRWSEPQVPAGWHSVMVADEAGPNTVVYTHR